MNSATVLLRLALNKCCCQHTIAVGDKIMKKLKWELLSEDYWPLSLARSHYILGEGRDEFDFVCNKLIKKYSTPTVVK